MNGEPPRITLEDHAAISAEIVEGIPLVTILRARGLTEEEWNGATLHWTAHLAADVRDHGVSAQSPQVYSEVFASAQERLRATAQLSVEQWATLEFRLETEDRSKVLAEYGLGLADHLRLVRLWSGRLSREEGLSQRYREICNALRSR